MTSSILRNFPFRTHAVVWAFVLSIPATASAADIWTIQGPHISAEVNSLYGYYPYIFQSPVSEVALESALLQHGDTVPLPQYDSDGQVADESETMWWVYPSTDAEGTCVAEARETVVISFVNRVLEMDPPTCTGGSPNSVLVWVLAARPAGGVASGTESVGRLKATYRRP